MKRPTSIPIVPPAWTKQAAALLAALLSATGCAALREAPVLPRDLPTMQQIYDQHHQRQAQDALTAARAVAQQRTAATGGVPDGDRALAAFSRSAYNEIELLFPRLPNPTLVMYVDPHLTAAGYPVPGYTTAFPLYEKVEYALPGEAPPPARSPIELRPTPTVADPLPPALVAPPGSATGIRPALVAQPADLTAAPPTAARRTATPARRAARHRRGARRLPPLPEPAPMVAVPAVAPAPPPASAWPASWGDR